MCTIKKQRRFPHEQHEQFLDYLDAAESLNAICVYPEADLKDMLDKIEECRPDAIVTDFLLNDIKEDLKYNISYNGVDLVSEYRKMRPGFPSFIITSFDNDAVSQTDDVNLVYVKGLLTNGEIGSKAKFYDRVIEQVSKYKTSVNNAQDELLKLMEKRHHETADLADERRIIELDDFLEKSLDYYQSVPAQMKELDNLKKMSSLIDRVDELIAKLS